MAVRWVENNLGYDQFLLSRLQTVGASEVATIVIGSKWSSSLELFYKKIGMVSNQVENIRMFLGTETEPVSEKCWTFYSGTEQSIVDNARKNNPIKKCRNQNATAFNDKYPFLSATPDRIIEPYGIYKGRGEGSLEIKNTQGYVLQAYDTGLPTDNVFQLCTQLMVCDLEYGELFYFIDNKRFECHAVERKDIGNIEETINHHVNKFFTNVLLARPLYNAMYEAKRNYNQRLVGELQNEIARLEPPVQFTDGWANFLNQKYKDRLAGVGVINGKDDHLTIARKHKELSKQIEKLEEEKLKIEIELKNAIADNSALNFGKAGEISWRENKSGKRNFLNKVK